MGLAGLLTGLGIYLYIVPSLPSIDSLKDVQFQVPLRIYSTDEKLIGEFGEKRRTPLEYDEIPDLMIKAVLGAEDDSFFEHSGIDYQGLVRAVGKLITTGKKVQGGGTITMQVARNFFLSREKTFLRKFTEILLAFKIERELDKETILELYLNKIYFGKRAYGIGAAALTYYGKDIRELDVAQLAMIAGLPKAPSRYNPVVNPKRALLRRNYVLRRMRDLGYIEEDLYREAVLSDVTAKDYGQSVEIEAPYVAEMVRKELVDQYGKDIYTKGYKVYTTVESRLQQQANYALRKALLDYETRHGYKGALQEFEELDKTDPLEWSQVLEKVSSDPVLIPGFVIEVENKSALVYLQDERIVEICWDGLKWAAPYRDGNWAWPEPKTASDVLKTGQVIYARPMPKDKWALGQKPEVQGAIVSLRSKDGAIQAIIGGYDFDASNFNRALQAKRQPGSNFKPFVYSAALEKKYTAASLINDAPVVFDDPGLEDTWRPENYSGKFFGPTRFREALVKSRNLVSIRILRSIGLAYAIDYVKKFGFDPAELPRDLSLALGSATVTPLSIARGYATFSNGGYRIDPYMVRRIELESGELVFEANPAVVCESCQQAKEQQEKMQEMVATPDAEELSENGFLALDMSPDEAASMNEKAIVNLAPRVLSEQNVYIMTSIMRDIINRGTGKRAKALKRNDLAGKTGTTNDQQDAWFSGFNGDIATTAWVGFDTPHPLGDSESGARAALPMWISYMREALRGTPNTRFVQPPGIVAVKIDPQTGALAGMGSTNAIFEIFRQERVPTSVTDVSGENGGASEAGSGNISEQLF